jgi:hypothetical protein
MAQAQAWLGIRKKIVKNSFNNYKNSLIIAIRIPIIAE